MKQQFEIYVKAIQRWFFEIVALMMVNTEKLLFQTTVLFHLPLSLIWQIYWIYCLIFFPYDFVL